MRPRASYSRPRPRWLGRAKREQPDPVQLLALKTAAACIAVPTLVALIVFVLVWVP